jgi:hypothetical protein
MNRNLITSLIAILSLTACAEPQALKDMKQSRAIYKACLVQNHKDVSACKREKADFEGDARNYEGMVGGGNTLDAPTSR